MTPPKKGLTTRPYSMDMNKDDHIVTLPKKGLKTGPYNRGMEKTEKKDLKKFTKGQLIKLLLKKVRNHEDLLDNDPFKNEVAQEPAKRIKPPPPPGTGKWESVKPKPVPRKTSYYHHQTGTRLFQNQRLTDHFKYLRERN